LHAIKAVIMAGGLGTRLASLTPDIPKPMIPVGGKPVLLHQIECLKKNNITDITFITGYSADKIEAYFGDGGTWGVNISYIVEEIPLGTAGGLYYLKECLHDTFLLINGDILFDVDFFRMFRWHKKKGAVATLLTHPNNHPYDSALVITDEQSRVTNWLHKEEPREDYNNRVNAGIHMLEPEVLEKMKAPVKTDLDRDMLKPMVITKGVFAYDTPEYVKDLGTPDRYERVCRDFENGLVEAKNLRHKQKAVFLDRDGTINKYSGFITHPDQIELLPGVSEAIRKLNNSAYLTIVVTNQPIIARGDCDHDELNAIHRRLERLLGEAGAYLDAIFYCPHHPDKGFTGERAEYKIECPCRKPQPGMLLQAHEKFNIDLSKSYMVGDHDRDVQAGLAAGCTSLKIDAQTPRRTSLLECVDAILEGVV